MSPRVAPPHAGPGTRFGNFELMSLLGKGGMAEVYKARVLTGPRQGWQVAVKRLLPALAQEPEYVELFVNEADLSRCLDHPNIVKVLEVGTAEELYFMAMELIDGRDLGQILRTCKAKGIPLPVDFAVYVGKVLLDALAYAHEAKGPAGNALGVVHCDVSSSNLFISRVGEIKLGDFGVARAKVRGGREPELLGKPFYLSPEVFIGHVTPEADVWAATVVLYELLTLERPFVGKTPKEVFGAIASRSYKPLRAYRPEVSRDLEDIVARAFSKERKLRFQSAAEMSAALTPHFNELVGTPLAIASVVRGLFGTVDT